MQIRPLIHFNIFEKWLNISLWTFPVIFSIYQMFITSNNYNFVYGNGDFQVGWSIFSRFRDASNFEWEFWSKWKISLLSMFISHTVLCLIFSGFDRQFRRNINLIHSVLWISLLVGWRSLVLILFPCFISYFVACFGSLFLSWITSIIFVTLMNNDNVLRWLRDVSSTDSSGFYEIYFNIFTSAMITLRYISFYSEWINSKKNSLTSENIDTDEVIQFSIIDMLEYCLYIPFMCMGPLMNYDVYYKFITKPKPPLNKAVMKTSIIKLCRVVIIYLINEVILHYFYFNALSSNAKYYKEISMWSLAGTAYSLGQFFHLKYLVFWGLPSIVCSFDGIETLGGPSCIAHIPLYSKMWKQFDRGLFLWFTKYIYIPFGGSRNGILRQVTARALCFLFVAHWHGGERYLYAWVSANFFGIMLETIASNVSNHKTVLDFRLKYLSSHMDRRLQGIITVPLTALYLIFIFIFLGGYDFGITVFKRLIIDGWPVSTFTVFISLYGMCQVGLEMQLLENPTLKLD